MGGLSGAGADLPWSIGSEFLDRTDPSEYIRCDAAVGNRFRGKHGFQIPDPSRRDFGYCHVRKIHKTGEDSCSGGTEPGLCDGCPHAGNQGANNSVEACAAKCHAAAGDPAGSFPGKSSGRNRSGGDHLQLAGHGQYGGKSHFLQGLSPGTGLCAVDRTALHGNQSAG